MPSTPRSTLFVVATALLGLGWLLVAGAIRGPDAAAEAGGSSALPPTEGATDEGAVLAPATSVERTRVAVCDPQPIAYAKAESTLPLFHARVVDDLDDRPVAGARVRLAPTSPATVDSESITSDADGCFVIPLTDGEPRPALVEARGYARLLFAAAPLHDDRSDPAVLRLRRGASLRVSVVGASGAGLPDVEVVLRAEAAELVQSVGLIVNPFLLEDEIWTARTDAGGGARLVDLVPGAALHVELRRDGRTLQRPARPILLSSGEEAEHEFVIGSGATLLGRVHDEAGVPVGGVEVWRLRGVANMVAVLRPDQRTSVLQKAITTDDGTFEMADVPVGTWWLGVKPNDVFAGDAATVAVTPTTLFSDVDLAVVRGLRLRGTVIGPDGPVAFAQIQARQLDGRLVYYSGLAREGAFELGPLVPGAYEVGASASGLIGPSVTAEAGDENVVIALTEGSVLHGRIVDAASGEPVTATVLAQETSAAHTFASIGRPPQVGSEFSFRDLRPVEYGLVARTSDGRVGLLRARAASSASAPLHEIPVAPGATLRLQVPARGSRGFVAIWLDDALLFGNGLQPGDRFDLLVPPGDLVLTWKSSGRDPIERIVGGAADSVVEVELGTD